MQLSPVAVPTRGFSCWGTRPAAGTLSVQDTSHCPSCRPDPLESATSIVWTPQSAVPIIQEDLHVTERPWTLHLTDAVQIPALSFSSVIICRLKGALTGKLTFPSRSLPTIKALGLTHKTGSTQRSARVHTRDNIDHLRGSF